jgi:hypothetical protein
MRSPSHGLLHRDMTVYLRAQGCTAKVYDTLNRFGIAFCQKSMYRMVEDVCDSSHIDCKADLQQYLSFFGYDNLVRQNVKQEERTDNKTTMDVGTAGTVYIIKDPDQPKPDVEAYIKKVSEGMKNPLSAQDIIDLEQQAAPDLRTRAEYRVLQILMEAPDFAFRTYPHREHSAFAPPAPVEQLPAERTTQYMSSTIHQEQGTYEGNDLVLSFYIDEFGVTTPWQQAFWCRNVLFVVVGDQLTTSRIRGLRQFRAGENNSFERKDNVRDMWGWMHGHLHYGTNLYKQHLGTTQTFGLAHAIDFLDRKGLNTPSTEGTFYSRLEGLILHTTIAHIRAAWLSVSGVESLADLRAKHPDELLDLAKRIVCEHASNEALLDFDQKLPAQRNEYQRSIIMYNRDALDWLILSEAIKTGDVGLMERYLPRMLFRFIGGGNTNYVVEILELLQGFHREWPDDVKYVH